MLDSGIDLSPIITATYPITKISEAFEDATNVNKNIKVIIDQYKINMDYGSCFFLISNDYM